MAVGGPPVTMAMVRAEHGGAPGTPLHAYVRGGAFVPDRPVNAGVPTAPPIRLAQLAGSVHYFPPVLSGPSTVNWNGGYKRPPLTYSTGSGQSVAVGSTGSGTASWAYVSGSTQIHCTTPSAVNSAFTCTGNVFDTDPERTETAVWRLSYTDGVTPLTKDVTFNFTAETIPG